MTDCSVPKKPEVIAVAAMSLDGKITFHDVPGNGFTSDADKAHFVSCLNGFDCSILGRTTFAASKEFILSRLTPDRLRVVITHSPQDYAQWAVPGQLEFTSDAPEAVLADLGRRGYQRCVHLGGSDAYASYQTAGCIDEWWLSLEPRIFGEGRPLCPGLHDVELKLLSSERLEESDTLLLKYRSASSNLLDTGTKKPTLG